MTTFIYNEYDTDGELVDTQGWDDFTIQIQCEEVYMEPNIVYTDPEFIVERISSTILKVMWDNGKEAVINDSLEEAIFLGESFGSWD